MSFSGLLVQLLNGLAGASSLFLVAAGLSLIFGVCRIVNFAHGSFYMVGLYAAYALAEAMAPLGGGWGFWLSLPLSAIAVGLLGGLVEVLLLRRIYKAPELFQLLATFALVLVIKDAVLWLCGPDELLGPRAPGLGGAVDILGRAFPSYDLFLIAVGPLVLGATWLLLHRSRFGMLVRAATQDREMVGALGVRQAWLFTAVFALGAALAGLGGALQLPREPATLELDLQTIGSAFVVVVVGGMGSLTGAFVAALLVSTVKALCIWLGVVQIAGIDIAFPQLTLVADFLVMAVVLVLRPWGLLGQAQAPSRSHGLREQPLRAPPPALKAVGAAVLLALLALPWAVDAQSYTLVLMVDLVIAALFATSLHFLMGPAGLHSFGHAAFFGLGAYGAALLLNAAGLPMLWALLLAPLLAALGGVLTGWFAVRLTGVYFSMLTLAFAQIIWATTFQWDSVTGGSNGLTGVWPAAWLEDKRWFYLLTLLLATAGVLALWRVLYAPLGYALRASRDAPLRAEAIGIAVAKVQWMGFVLAASVAGLAGALFAFSKGSISPETMSVAKSVDGLVMVLLGGVQTLVGPILGAFSFTWLHDAVARNTDYWRATLGAVILLLVLLFPQGIAGYGKRWWQWLLQQRGA
ncbi:ABC transporter permease [Comamonas sp. JUb58]|uniref:ABC transporter permease n=1 Tax=Comamonas sp. JUb58 TaxID=2485114 RepID=UPI00105BC946|nr:ABC transporter permease [Comamonas sp. JUb58]TDS81682.1 amino acid/amide ABC transporter membrane protein 1 (HAAT family) /amino acid/amide ABC transporter membrane protein 2 (HAAT family) [Comamonas sp. JUb58]